MSPKVTVITITYNAERFLKSTIESVVNQSCKDFEYLVIDGDSKDGTRDIICQYSNCHYASYEDAMHRKGEVNGLIHWISEPDKGLYDAMNKGIHLAKGDFVWFINAGDKIFDDETMQTVVNVIDRDSDCDVVYGQSIIIDEGGNVKGERHKIAPANLCKKSLLNGLVVCHQSILVRREIAPDYDLQYCISSDYDWVCNVLGESRRNSYIDDYISCFMTDGLSSKHRKKAWWERYLIMKKHFGFLATFWAHVKIVVKYPLSRKY
jgi:glycosyltransferase involved in cell wall biosynthesis